MCDDLFDDQAPEEKTGELLWLKTSTSLQKVWKKIFQKSLNSAKVPHIRKEANVSPIFKKGDKSDPANYRPISRDGYRDGHSAGEELSLQDGFNEGFSSSTQVLFHIAQLRGEISGILSLSLMKGGTLDSSTESRLQEHLGDVVLFETEMLNFTKTVLEKFKSHSSAYSCVELGAGDTVCSTELEKSQQVPKDSTHGDDENLTHTQEKSNKHVDLKLKQFKDKLKELLQVQ